MSIAASAQPDTTGWSVVLYRDANCDGTLQAGEPQLTSALTVSAGETVCVLAKVFVPAQAPYDARHVLDLNANFTYTNASPELASTLTRTDRTSVGGEDAGLKLTKQVDKPAAKPGDTLTYTISYANTGREAIQSLRIHDATPPYTAFVSAACGALPPDFTACAVTAQPDTNKSGSIAWDFTGPLAPDASGTVSFSVTLQ